MASKKKRYRPTRAAKVWASVMRDVSLALIAAFVAITVLRDREPEAPTHAIPPQQISAGADRTANMSAPRRIDSALIHLLPYAAHGSR